MTDDELRALVREAVARHLGRQGSTAPEPAVARASASPPPHSSHFLYLTLVNDGDACLIEPAVPCNHCGYCKSHGH